MKNLISVEKLIESAKAKGIDFGKGDPYNRLRYYTKMGWLPHMVRKKGEEDNEVKGHYPEWALERLIQIERLKNEGLNNEEIAKKVNSSNKFQSVYDLVNSSEFRIRTITYASFFLILVILGSEFGILRIGKVKSDSLTPQTQLSMEITDRGNSYLPSQQRKVFVKSGKTSSASKVYITFKSNYTPAQRYWVSQIVPQEGFIVELDTPVAEDSEFTWWVSN